MDKIAIIDCGTNTFHLLIAASNTGGYEVLHKERVPVRIGKGGINQNILLPDAVARATETLQHFASIINKSNVSHTYAFATSAFRNATNGKAVRESILQKTGIEINIISGVEEAEFIFWGVNSAFDLGTAPVLVMDIGGGSVEFIIGRRDHILWRESFEIGAQRLLELFHKTEPIQKKEVRQLEAYLEINLKTLLDQINFFNPSTLIGSSGTFDTLSEIYCKKNSITLPKEAPEVPLPIKAYEIIHSDLLQKTRAERMAIPGMIEMRVDMIVVASCLITFLLKNHHFKGLRVATYALKEGVLNRLLNG